MSSNPIYRTTNQEYSNYWYLTNDTTTENYKVPTFEEINNRKREYEKLIKNMKNNALKDIPVEKNKHYSEEDLIKKKLDPNIILSKNFDIKAENMYYPDHALKIGNQLYMTSNMDYGRLKPTQFEINSKYYPTNNKFTSQNKQGIYKNNGLNTTVTRSKVNDLIDNYD